MRPLLRLEAGALLLYLALGSLFAAIPRFATEELGTSRALAGFAVSIFFVAAVATRPIAGRLVDTRGRRPFLVWPPFAIAALLLVLHGAGTIWVVLAVRFLQGVFGAAFYVAAVTATTDLSAPTRRASAVASLSIALYLGFAVGPAIGEALLDRGAGTAWFALATVAALAGVCTATLPETRPTATTGAPAGPSRFLHPAAFLPGIAMLALGVGYTSITALSALNARRIGLDSSGSLYATFAISVLCVRLVSGRLADRVGPARVAIPGMLVYAAGFAILASSEAPSAVVSGVALVGIGWALVLPAVTAWLATHVPDTERGAALGSLIAYMDLGQGVGGYLVGGIADRSGFGWAYTAPAVLALGATAVFARAVRHAPPGAPSTAPAPLPVE